MRVLLDNNLNPRFGRLLTGHEVEHAKDRGWGELKNGALLKAAEAEGFRVIVSGDRNMEHQQNLIGQVISVIVIRGYRITLKHIESAALRILDILADLPAGQFLFVTTDRTDGA